MLDPLSLNIPFDNQPPSTRPILPRRFLLQPSPTSPDDYLLEIDNSTLEQLSVCYRKFENYAVHGREKAGDDSATSFGTLFHTCEELRLRVGLSPETVARQRELVVEHFSTFHPRPEDHRTADRMIQVLNAYNTTYANDGWPDSIYMHEGEKFLERPFKVELCTIPINGTLPYSYNELVGTLFGSDDLLKVRNLHIIWTGKIDLIKHDSNALWVADHKTTSMGGKEWEEAFRLARQTVGYAWAGQQIIGQPIAGCIINGVIIRAPAKTARATLPREEFPRMTYHYSQDRIEEWYEGVRYMMTDLANSLLRGYFPMTGPKSFKSPCVYCSYHENCQLPRSQRAADLSTDQFRDVTWSPTN